MRKVIMLLRIIKSCLKEGILVTQANICEWRRIERLNNLDVLKYHTTPKSVQAKQKEIVWDKKCKISILTPLYNTPIKYLEEMILSVQNQTYADWELCLGDGSDSEHQYIQEVCLKFATQDSRIKYFKIEKNEGISGNTNRCFNEATGEYIAILDHDDILHPCALYEVRRIICEKSADFIYTDEAKFYQKPEETREFNLKPGYGKDELRSHNYICHFNVFKRSLLEKTGSLYRSEFDGSQDHDMVLRLTERAKEIVHIPKILYYWRVHANSVAMDLDSKPYAIKSAIQAVSEQLVRCNEPGLVGSNLPYRSIYRVKYKIKQKATVTIILHHTYRIKNIKKHITNIYETTSYPLNEILYDPDEKVRGRASFLNELIVNATGEHIVFLDARCIPNNYHWVEEMLMFSQRKDIFAVGGKVIYKKKILSSAGVILDITSNSGVYFLGKQKSYLNQGYEAMYKYVRNATVVSDVFLMVEKKKLLEVRKNDFDIESYEDMVMCLNACREGYVNVWTCFAEMNTKVCNWHQDYYMKNQEAFIAFWCDEFGRNEEYAHPLWKELELI